MLTITVTFEAPDGLDLRYICRPPTIPVMHLIVFGQALLAMEDPHMNRYRGEKPEEVGVVEATFPDAGKAGLIWWWHGLSHPREQLKALGEFMVNQARIQFLKSEMAAQAKAQQQGTILELPGGRLFYGQRTPMSG